MWSRGTKSMQHVRDLRRVGARPCLPLDSPATCPGTHCVVRPLAPVPINERRAVVHALAFDTPLQAGHRDVYMMHMRHKTYQHYTPLQAGHEETYIWCICVRPYEHYAHFENKRKNDNNNNHIVQHLKKKTATDLRHLTTATTANKYDNNKGFIVWLSRWVLLGFFFKHFNFQLHGCFLFQFDLFCFYWLIGYVRRRIELTRVFLGISSSVWLQLILTCLSPHFVPSTGGAL